MRVRNNKSDSYLMVYQCPALVARLVYVIAWVAVVFGINCASNAGRRLVIVRGAAEHYYCFLPTLREQLIQNTTANHAIIN